MSCTGYSRKVLEEVQQLRRLARRGEERARLGNLIDTLSAQAATAPGVQQEAARPNVEVCISLGSQSCIFPVTL